ncbi:hypothetical protein [Massilibacterium senegalense]|uniref:hypothetical protein n=1 Tax=Massilibacterium senegalense TaxID=1632858 RepID=UPI000782424B|nr:hypothetical protein [Massilibacterium senegalense]
MKKNLLNGVLLLKQLFAITVFTLIGINVMQDLGNHVENQNVQMNILDFYSMLFINTQNPNIDYIDFRQPSTLLGIITILFTGAIYTSTHFLKFNKQYFYMVLIRYGNMKSYIREMQRKSLRNSLIFTLLLYVLLFITVFSLDKSIFWLNSSYSSYSMVTNLCYIFVYFLILFLFIFTINRLMIYLNLIKGSVLAILLGLTMPVIILMIDINQTKLNILSFDYNRFFLDSLSVAIILNVLISILGKKLLNKYKLYI